MEVPNPVDARRCRDSGLVSYRQGEGGLDRGYCMKRLMADDVFAKFINGQFCVFQRCLMARIGTYQCITVVFNGISSRNH